MFGIILCTFFNIWEINSPSVILSLLFGTTLAPIAGSFGWLWGIIAGVLHACLVMNITYLHGGMILYNNGFSGGLVCMFLLPLILNDLTSQLNMPRRQDIEEYYWALNGDNDSSSELSLVGMMTDSVDVNYTNDVLKISLTRLK